MGLLRPGDRLPAEARLAEDLGISPVTLRSALAILRAAGVLETQRGRAGGTFVTEAAAAALPPNGPSPSEAELRDLVDERAVVEGGAAGLAAERATQEQLAELERLAGELETTPEYEPWSARDTLFHLLIADASGSQRLVSRVAELRADVYRLSRRLPVPRQVVELADREHREILKALRARRPERARTAMVRHVESTRAFWLGLGRVG
jgi:GntR family transcriptional repressor for pyruvate dehydrogenase complex